MSDALCKAFNESLSLKNLESGFPIDMTQYSEIQQAQIQQYRTLSKRFPSSFDELNDTLRDSTFLLNGTEASEVDAYVLGQAGEHLSALKTEDIVRHRHVVRWALFIQKLVKKEFLTVNLDTPAPRELPKKEKKSDTADAKKESKKSSKSDNKPVAAESQGNNVSEEPKNKKEKKEKKEKKPAPAAAPARAVTPGMIDLRVGFIEKAEKHPDADSLYVSTINVGEAEPRTICSGLVRYIPIENMQKQYVVVVANLKPVKMRGILSNGMVLCASNKADDKVEFVKVPEGSAPGDKLFFEGFDEEPETVLNPKKKLWEQIQPDFTTTESLNVVYKKEGKEHKLVNKKGQELTSSTIKNAAVS